MAEIKTDRCRNSRGESPHEERTSQAPSSAGQLRISWSIGIYTGPSPLHLRPPLDVRNPVLSAHDVSDARAAFVADPFMIFENGRWYMFFEVMNEETDKGEIGLAVSQDGWQWRYRQIVLAESFHLSYPYVFKWGNDFYMMPETLAEESVCLYRANDFPTRWSRVGKLISGKHADPSPFHFNARWWMLACAPIWKSDTLRLYYADDLMGDWREHPRSPVVEGDARTARPAGRIIEHSGGLIRFAQDCHRCYGNQVRAFRITELTPTTYAEMEVESSPVLCAAGHGWNGDGMHQLDAHLTEKEVWVACVDGKRMQSVTEL